MATLGDLVINLTARTDRFTRGLNMARRSTRSFTGDVVNSFAKIGLAAQGLRTSFELISKPLEFARTQIQSEAKLANVLETTGNAAGFSAEQLKKYASARQEATNFGDETSLQGLAVLATFTSIRDDQFIRAFESAQDMTSLLGGDLQSKILQVGKALNDPAKGLSALAEAGVQFSDSQKEMVKRFVEVGDVAGAQGVILQELERQFGGMSEKMRDDVTQLSNSWGDFLEEVGKLASIATPAFKALRAEVEVMSVALSHFQKNLEKSEFLKQGLLGKLGIISHVERNPAPPSAMQALIPKVEDSLAGHRGEISDVLKNIEQNRAAFNKPGVDVNEPRIDMSGVAPNIGDKTLNDLRRATAQWKPNEHAAGQFLAGMIREGLDRLQSGVMSLGPLDKEAKEADQQLGALEKGSREAMDVIAANTRGGKDKLPEKQLNELKDIKKELSKMSQGLLAKAKSVFEVKGLN